MGDYYKKYRYFHLSKNLENKYKFEKLFSVTRE